MNGKEVTKRMKKLLVLFLAFAMVVAISLPSFAQDSVEGKIEALNKAAKKITINGTEYSLSNKAAQVKVKVGDMVQATVDGNIVTKLGVLN
jgi:hypothetical protein